MDRGAAGGQGGPLSDDAYRTSARTRGPGCAGPVPAVERLSRIAALALGFDHGTVLLPDGRTVPRSGDRPPAAADLDRQVLSTGTALVVERAGDELGPLGS